MKKQKTTITNITDIERLLTSISQEDKNVGKFMLNKADMTDEQTAREMHKFINKVKPPVTKSAITNVLGYILIINDKDVWSKNNYGRSILWQSKGSPKSNYTTYMGYSFRNPPYHHLRDMFGNAKEYTKFLAKHGIIKTYEVTFDTSTNVLKLNLV